MDGLCRTGPELSLSSRRGTWGEMRREDTVIELEAEEDPPTDRWRAT